MRRLGILLGVGLGLIGVQAHAQVVIMPPRGVVYQAPPGWPVYAPAHGPVFAPGPRIFWHPRRVVIVRPVPVPVYVQQPIYQSPQPQQAYPVYQPPVYQPPVYQVPVYQPPPVVYLPPIYVVQPQVQEPCPPDPCDACQAQEPPPPPAAATPPVAAAVAKPAPVDWPHTFGLGFRFGGQIENTDWRHLSFGGELLFRTSARTTVELSGEYQHGVNNDLDRLNVPVGLGLRLHIGKPSWVVSPYLVGAGVFTYARTDLKATVDEAYYLGGQVGGGLELRLGKRVAITADARFDGRVRLDDPSNRAASITSVNGHAVHVARANDAEYGGVFRLGAAVYF